MSRNNNSVLSTEKYKSLREKLLDKYSFICENIENKHVILVDTDIEFTSYIPEDLPVLSADSVKLRQALLNLLRNAADAVRTESPSQDQHDMPAHSPQISLSVTADADLLHIEISDNGCGIAPEDQEHIFEPFITHKVDGTGLGLAITRRIIQAHHGTITLRSARYAGTVFILTLPLEKNS